MPFTSVFSFVLIFSVVEAAEHCNVTANASTFFEPYARFEICPYNSKHSFCDRSITPDWYRVDDAMLTQCPQLLSCGTLYPVWLNGSLPTETEDIVDVKACKVGFADCCSMQYDVKIKYCGSFYAYCLGPLESCSERYCFGEKGFCGIPSTGRAGVGGVPSPAPTTDVPSTNCSEDPCIESNVQTLPQPKDRSTQCEYRTEDSYCDNNLNPGWYKHEYPMVTQCPSLLGCGTIYPVWLNGTIPSTSDDVVTRKACQKGYDNCCSTSHDIKIKNCGNYTAYCLKGLNTCSSRYCFGVGGCEDRNVTKSNSNDDDGYRHVNLTIYLAPPSGTTLVIVLIIVLLCNKKALCKKISNE